MKFSEFPYIRPHMDEFESVFRQRLEVFRQAGSAEEQGSALHALNDLRSEYESMGSLAVIRHRVDTEDAFYKEEQQFFDDSHPRYEGLLNDYYRALLATPYWEAMERQFGKRLFDTARLEIGTFSPDIMEELREENRLTSAYTKRIASARIVFDGEERTLPQLARYQLSPNRDVRKQAADAKYRFFEEHEEELDDIYDKLVKVRARMAAKLGYPSYVELAYDRLNRSDYGPDEVASFRKQVEETIVPVASSIKRRQADRIGVESLTYYDDKFEFPSGNPAPRGDADWILAQAVQMYDELSPETSAFFHDMVDRGLMDLVSKKGKATGGFCDYLVKFGAPFIYSNFNGTAADVRVLTHEAGHAFQASFGGRFGLPEYIFPTMEAAEIHSMSMEFFTWPWMELFYGDEADKSRYAHLTEQLTFIPYGVAVDEYQHWVYEHAEASPAERKAAWRQIEKRYLPHLDYAGMPFLERGGYWMQQSHIFRSPFYYIDYTLAQVCAFQFWQKAEQNRESAWSDYVRLCQAAGSKSFLELVSLANLTSPFEDGCIRAVMGDLEAWLGQVDESMLTGAPKQPEQD
ncbi:oligoendopeptidase F [Paenibacillus sp. J31TS4]|uniref:M3 family oligoendopeptidase n=1 Tax=Paenibacillus sp. J31TS4 TaxID=2807195 RepID=UPI001B2E525E|nr:M3 family oligoendopeptidase [Paenibacillus sp. J31TS4]GIP36964.1 oligoendopeptidase F [Paenibacillus sp. J31TS4]